MDKLRTIRGIYVRHLARVATLRTWYVIPARQDGLRAHHRHAVREALALARAWRTRSTLP